MWGINHHRLAVIYLVRIADLTYAFALQMRAEWAFGKVTNLRKNSEYIQLLAGYIPHLSQILESTSLASFLKLKGVYSTIRLLLSRSDVTHRYSN